jgi:hypothetical protein
MEAVQPLEWYGTRTARGSEADVELGPRQKGETCDLDVYPTLQTAPSFGEQSLGGNMKVTFKVTLFHRFPAASGFACLCVISHSLVCEKALKNCLAEMVGDTGDTVCHIVETAISLLLSATGP